VIIAFLLSLLLLLRRRLFPAFQKIRQISKVLTARVAEHMVGAGLGATPGDFAGDWETYVADKMWHYDHMQLSSRM
jgi:hypothetical protein